MTGPFFVTNLRIISSAKEINRLFYSVEKDSYDNVNHVHLLLESTNHALSRKDVAQAAGLRRNPKAISFVQEVDSKKAVSSYTTKYIGNPNVYYGIEGKAYYNYY